MKNGDRLIIKNNEEIPAEVWETPKVEEIRITGGSDLFSEAGNTSGAYS